MRPDLFLLRTFFYLLCSQREMRGHVSSAVLELVRRGLLRIEVTPAGWDALRMARMCPRDVDPPKGWDPEPKKEGDDEQR